MRRRKGNICHTKEDERRFASPVLYKADGSRLFAEALAAQVETILADETGLVSAEAALAGSLAILARTRKPDGVVGHFGWAGLAK